MSVYEIAKKLGLEKEDVDSIISRSADVYKAGTWYGTVSSKDVYKAGTFYGTVSSNDVYKAGTFYGTVSINDF